LNTISGVKKGALFHLSTAPSLKGRFNSECNNDFQRTHMFVILWQFDIAEDRIAGFEEAYGPSGSWSRLFSRSNAYLGTELLKDAYVPGRYVTVDRWINEDAFRAFRAEYDADYETLDRSCDAFTASETRIGAFVA
jgi:heme-degrading monooxygenase HmoA